MFYPELLSGIVFSGQDVQGNPKSRAYVIDHRSAHDNKLDTHTEFVPMR